MADLTVEYTLTTPGPDIVFNDGTLWDGLADKYWIDAIQGLDGPTIRAPVDLVPFGDGGIVHTFRLGPRRIIFDGMLLLDPPTLTNCQARRNDLRDNLLSALASIVTASGTLAWTDTGASSYSIAVFNEVGCQITYTDDFRVSRFSFGLVSEDANP